MASVKSTSSQEEVEARPVPRTQRAVDQLIDWYERYKPNAGKRIDVKILRRTALRFAKPDKRGNSIARRAVEHQRKWQMKYGQSEYVFPSNWVGNKGGRVRASGKAWDNAWKNAKLPVGQYVKRGIHCCRHVFAYRLRAAGTPKEDRDALLGHSNADISSHYAPADIGRLLAYAELVTERKTSTVLRVVG